MKLTGLVWLYATLAVIYTASASLCGLCETDWRKVYTNSADGTTQFGDKSDLVHAVRSGSHVRIFVEEWSDSGYAAETDNMEVIGDGICAQALFHVSRTGQRFQDNAYWWFLKLCTTGNVHIARYSVGEAQNRGEDRLRLKISWFIKDVVCRCLNQSATFSNDVEGSTVSGDKTALVTATLSGQDIRAHTSGYTFPLNNVAVSSELVSGQTLWHVSQSTVDDHVEFQPNAYWWFTVVSTNGFRDMSRWTIGSHQDRGHTNDNVATSWFADPCWKKVYAHDSSGNAVSGDRKLLVSAVEAGHRVRVVTSNYSIEVDNVRAVEGHVSAQLLGHVSKANTWSFQNNAYWYFQIVHTSGYIHTSRYNVGEHVSRGTSEGTAAIEWFVDTRPWEMILETNSYGQVVSGSKDAVRNAIQKGASFRISPQFCSGGGVYVANANNLELEAGGEASATSLKHVSMSRVRDVPGVRYKIQDNPYWWFIIVNTQSQVSMSRWSLGEHRDRDRTTETATRVQWFVNY